MTQVQIDVLSTKIDYHLADAQSLAMNATQTGELPDGRLHRRVKGHLHEIAQLKNKRDRISQHLYGQPWNVARAVHLDEINRRRAESK